MTRILLAALHPAKLSFSTALAQAYRMGAEAAGHEVRFHHLADMQFDMDFGQPTYRAAKAPEPDLARFLEDMEWAEHTVMVAPMWWGGLPARAKGLFDRAFLPGTAFDPRERHMGLPKPLFKGRSARVILTSDTPGWAFRLLYGAALKRQLAGQILGFVGLKPTRFTHFSPVEKSTAERRQGWLKSTQALGAAAA